MTRLWVSDLRDGQVVSSEYQVRSRQLRPHRGRSGLFLVFMLGDRSGQIQAVLWQDGERWYNTLRDGDIVQVTGRCQLYQNAPQLVIESLSKAITSPHDMSPFVQASSRDSRAMTDELRASLASVKEPHLQALLGIVFDQQGMDSFRVAPAARHIHHAYVGGLLEHTLEVVRFCELAAELHPKIDRDLLIAAAILHDIGKLREYRSGPTFDRTNEGVLLGHIVMADELIVSTANAVGEFPAELLLRLRHMLLSHHGQYEWQSPKRPKTLEAAVLHLADYMSSQLALFTAAIAQGPEGDTEWTAFSRELNRRIYVGETTQRQMPTAVREEQAEFAVDPRLAVLADLFNERAIDE